MTCKAPTFAIAMAAALVACGPRITSQNIEAVNGELEAAENAGRAVTTKAVESMLGQPARVEKFTMEVQTRKPTVEGVRYYYQQDGKEIVLHFVDNKLIQKVPKFDEKEGAEAPSEKAEPAK